MGGDGGSISQRVEMVRMKKKQTIESDPNQVKVDRWTTCSLNHDQLCKPIVVDELGNLYNKSSVIEYLLTKKTLAATPTSQSQYLLFDHIQSLKDVWECKFTEKKEEKTVDSTSSKAKKSSDTDLALGLEIDFAGRRLSRFGCPITGLPANGLYKFVIMRVCGCVISEKALKEVPSQTCLGCSRPLDDSKQSKSLWHAQNHWIYLNPGGVEEERLRKLIAAHQKNKKKSKKHKDKSKLKIIKRLKNQILSLLLSLILIQSRVKERKKKLQKFLFPIQV